jgi:hypothetical protein
MKIINNVNNRLADDRKAGIRKNSSLRVAVYSGQSGSSSILVEITQRATKLVSEAT